jgi:EAL domain-containing protein (putative c-di-GMP-specific phosphodiesterase class I)
MASVGRGDRSARHPILEPVFQPIVDLRTGRVVAYEALSRPRAPDGTALRAADVFQAAEAGGYAPDLDRLAIAAVASRAEDLPAGCRLFVNVSPATLLSRPAALAPLAPLAGRVVLELTERRPVASAEEPLFRRRLARLRRAGFALALDDLGDGYAGLGRVLTVEPEYIKLGMSIVHGVHADRRRAAMVGAMVHFARRAGALLVAEGIETEVGRATLRELGVDLGQGFLFAPPQASFVRPSIPAPAAAEDVQPWLEEALAALSPLMAQVRRRPARQEALTRATLSTLRRLVPADAYGVRRLGPSGLTLLVLEGDLSLPPRIDPASDHPAALALRAGRALAAAGGGDATACAAVAAAPVYAAGKPWGSVEVAFRRSDRVRPHGVEAVAAIALLLGLLVTAAPPGLRPPSAAGGKAP